ncbi:MAG TPA: phosphoadenylyl-sulfate reductase, partial [Alphaproteobacteria bacterium]|nr:phosphoadenylyl-sulfate reductase [Alphaproteobacteria bacterium]
DMPTAEQRLAGRLSDLRARYEDATAQELLEGFVRHEYPGEIAVVSSFGSEAVVLLHMLSEIDPGTPVIFLNTGKLFGETLRYRDRLQEALGLTDLRSIHPHPDDEKMLDPNGNLWRLDHDACCHFRKVLPLRRALEGFKAEVSGRKRFQTKSRAVMETIEVNEGRIKINPLADWTLDQLNRYMDQHDLPRHPLVKDGYLSIGCFPCTERVASAAEYRAGRWAGTGKDECGIHEPRLIDGEGI